MENTTLNCGKYKGTPIKDVPEDYVRYCLNNNILKGKLMVYCKIKLDYPKDKYEVTVEDSINQDGIYLVEAYSTNHAIKVCQKTYNIQNTQSFCGTSYSCTKK